MKNPWRFNGDDWYEFFSALNWPVFTNTTNVVTYAEPKANPDTLTTEGLKEAHTWRGKTLRFVVSVLERLDP